MLLQHFRAKCKLPTRNSEEPTGITLPVIAHETPKPLIIPVIAEHGFTMMVGEEDSQLVNIGKWNDRVCRFNSIWPGDTAVQKNVHWL